MKKYKKFTNPFNFLLIDNFIEKETFIRLKNQIFSLNLGLDKENKEHYESLYETKLKEQQENLSEQNSEKQKLWELKEKRLISTIEDLQKKATQGTTVDQGSSAEMQLGDFLKKISFFLFQSLFQLNNAPYDAKIYFQ